MIERRLREHWHRQLPPARDQAFIEAIQQRMELHRQRRMTATASFATLLLVPLALWTAPELARALGHVSGLALLLTVVSLGWLAWESASG